jgi:2-oxo-4-hydroxy-4-carboxy-5-ureidoimidazoline decarboxylase
MPSLDEVNRLAPAAFAARFGAVFEHSPWVAEQAARARPFASAEELHRAMMRAVREAPLERRLALVRAHPELAAGGRLTAASSGEQERLGFTVLSENESSRMRDLNRRYREKFGFPCIVALRLHASRETVMLEMARRLDNDAGTELAAALEQIGHIARGRLEKILDG